MQTVTEKRELPDEIALGYFAITVPIDDREEADRIFESFIKRVTGEFALRHKELTRFYTLDFEIEHVTDGSKKYHTKSKLKLKKRWKALKAMLPKGWVLGASIAAAVAGYPEVKEGATEIYEDLTTVIELVIREEHSKNSLLVPEVDSCGPEDEPTIYRA